MSIVKNTYGVSVIISPRNSNYDKLGTLAGSCLNRKETVKKIKLHVDNMNLAIKKRKPIIEVKAIKPRKMSQRTKSKIRKKIISFSQVQNKLSFVTLTFCNVVEDKVAVKILASFLDNVKKLSKDFQYLWVAEKQSKNTVFIDNIHFHLITNKYWDIKKWWGYWLDVQAKAGIKPANENYKPSSAFDVRQINSQNIKSVGNYLTKYVTKNLSVFGCQVWNCSKKISRLYTDFYSGMSFIRQLEKLEEAKLLGGEIKTFKQEYCDVKLIPLNRVTLPFYKKIERENRRIWNYETQEKFNNTPHDKTTI